MAPDTRIIPCQRCGGDGGHEIWTGYDPRNGDAIGHWQKCSLCDGTGDNEIELEPIEEEDLDEMGGL